MVIVSLLPGLRSGGMDGRARSHKEPPMLTERLALRVAHPSRPALWRRVASSARRRLRALADRVRLVRARKPGPGERLRVVIELGSFDKGGLEKVVLDSAIAFDRARIEPLVVTPGTV